MPSEDPKSFRPAGERWAGIKRTQQRMAPPPGGEDIDALLAKSMEAYWATKEREAASEMVDTSEVFRKAAALFRKDFWSDFCLASIPIALVLLTYMGLRRADIALPDWLPWVGSAFALLLFTGAWLVLLRGRRFIPWLRYSVGALAAGLLMSTVVGIWLFRQSEANTTIALVALRGEIEDVAVSSLLHRWRGHDWLSPQIKSAFFSLQSSDPLDGNRVVYRASAQSFPGELVANLEPASGEVRWVSANRNSLQTAFVVGRLLSVEGGVWKVQASPLSPILELWPGPKVLEVQANPGDCLIVAYQPSSKRNTVQRVVRLNSCVSPEEESSARTRRLESRLLQQDGDGHP